MRTTYKVLAYAVAVEVVVQAVVMVWAIAGLGLWVEGGGVFDKSVLESEANPFSEAVGFMIHGINGTMLIPVLALALVIVSFFVRGVAGARKWAGIVLLVVVVQATLGILGHVMAIWGALHGLNALLLFAAALYTARLVTRTPAVSHASVPADVTERV